MMTEVFDSTAIHKLLNRTRTLAASAPRVLVTLDGPCASGKTTLAALLAAELDADVIHTDDYVVPHSRKTPERLSIPGGNCDWERLVNELLIPWKQLQKGICRRYDCRQDCLMEPDRFPDRKILILEGSYCNLPAIRELADIRAFLDASREERFSRLLARESAWSMKKYQDLWIPLEEAYLNTYHLPDDGMILFQTSPPFSDSGRKTQSVVT